METACVYIFDVFPDYKRGAERANNLVRKPLSNVLMSARLTGGWRAPEPDFNLRSADAALMPAFGVVVRTTVEKL